MYCPFCHAQETKVTDSRLVQDGEQVRRRRECLTCKERFTTYEMAELALPRVIKNNGRRDLFDINKLRAGMLRALEKRPINLSQVEIALNHIIRKARAMGEREISSTKIGEWVMEELHRLDHVAYIRFASVYRNFEDINEFQETVRDLEKNTTHTVNE